MKISDKKLSKIISVIFTIIIILIAVFELLPSETNQPAESAQLQQTTQTVQDTQSLQDIQLLQNSQIVENTQTSEEDTKSSQDEQASGESQPKFTFRNASLLKEHYEKHGIEMGFTSAADYEKAASAVVSNPNALHKLEAEDGDDVYYLEDTNEFVIVSTDGYIRTYFYPDKGIKYFNGQ